jgi:hypothetical protein
LSVVRIIQQFLHRFEGKKPIKPELKFYATTISHSRGQLESSTWRKDSDSRARYKSLSLRRSVPCVRELQTFSNWIRTNST